MRSNTELGKYLKKLRIDESETIANMAEKLEVSSSFLSAIEVGKKNLPDTMADKLHEAYDFDDTQKKEFYEARSITNNKVEISLEEGDSMRNSLALSFGWKIANLSQEQIDEIKEILEKE